jgi:hypothetical protein
VSDFFATVKRQFDLTNGLMYALLYIFVITFVFFPAIVDATYLSWMHKDIAKNELSWFQLFMLLNFNVSDTIGRTLGGSGFCAGVGRNPTLIGSYSRTFFFITYFLIMFQVGPDGLFVSDWFKILNTFIFGFTNGFFSTRCAILAPGVVAATFQQETGSMIGSIISIGILMGSIVAIPMEQFIKMSPPTPLNP